MDEIIKRDTGFEGKISRQTVKAALYDCTSETDFWELFHRLEFRTRVGNSLIVLNVESTGDMHLGGNPAGGHPVRSLHRRLADGLLSRKLTTEEMGSVRRAVRGGQFSLSYLDELRRWHIVYWWKDWYPAKQFGGPMLSNSILGI